MRELVGRPDDKLIEGIARVELVIRGIEIELGLRRNGLARESGLGIRAYEFQSHSRAPNFRQDRLQNLAVRVAQPLAEKTSGHANDQTGIFHAFLPGGAKPGSETVGVHAAFRVLQNLVPEGHRENKSS